MTKLDLEEARKRDFHRISLKVVAENIPATRVYEKAGFLHECRMKDAYFGEDEKYYDKIVMGIIL